LNRIERPLDRCGGAAGERGGRAIMLKSFRYLLFAGGDVGNLVRTFVVLAILAALAIYGFTAFAAQEALWFLSGFNDLPDRLIVYYDGQQVELQPGDPGFEPLAEAVRTSLSQGVARQSNVGLSEASLEDAYTLYVTLEAYFDSPVKLHAGFFTGESTQMLFPITGRHSDLSIVFLGNEGRYRVNAPVLKNAEPVHQAVEAFLNQVN
jgi:hypothetical protein